MNISENKRVVALSAVFALAFGGVMYYGYSESQKYAANEAKITEIRDRFDGYINKEMPPTKQNLKDIKSAFSEVAATRADMQAEMNRYAEKCLGDGKKIPALEFQERLNASCEALAKMAADQNVSLTGSARDMGMETHRKATTKADNVPFLEFERRVIQRVSEILIGANVASFNKVYCHALPEEALESLTPGNRKAAPYFPLSFEVEFEAMRGGIPAIVNSIVKEKDYFLTITGIAVDDSSVLPGLDAFKKPGAASEAANLGETPAPAEADLVAVRKVGSKDEKVRVYMTLQVLYFTPGMTK